ncbi:L,D-transpeptidase family protein [Sinorhizobium sp. BG8]|uniref:L,D-transpeptidase family protein n=1 Tax=Sinorhizobium sp. BG8 TaxID=2613773 RepID=UPI00193E8337|nr:L,D-transpeptidase family protein [Sinorhizobium sp. BG8]QRM56763.1 L,D-transpeptidase family protein [Sinorhizobium sp. BG8]
MRPIVVRRAVGAKHRAILHYGEFRAEAAIGRNGTTAFKGEGDGATPIATMKLLYGFVRGDRMRSLPTALPLRRTRSDMLWCDQSGHPAYNRLVKSPFKASAEDMMRKDDLYDICLVLDWNITSRRRERGSAIFLHLIRPGYEPTAGCVALELSDLRRLLRYLRVGTPLKVI